MRHLTGWLWATWAIWATFAALLFIPVVPAVAGPTTPFYAPALPDAVTGNPPNPILFNGKRYWSIPAGADSYQNNFYERPTTQTFIDVGGGRYGAAEYFGNLDIVQARSGYDSRYLYVAIDLFSVQHELSDGTSVNEGLIYRYGFRLSTSDPDGADGFLFVVDQPGLLGTSYQELKNEAFKDTNADVGGAGGAGTTKDQGDVQGDGFDLKIVADGKLLDGPNQDAAVLFSRINPLDPRTVELALDYGLLGIDPSQILSLDFEAIKGHPKDPQNYLWNDKYTFGEAGTPYGTAGTQNVAELDTLHGGAPGGQTGGGTIPGGDQGGETPPGGDTGGGTIPGGGGAAIPEPSSLAIAGVALLGLFVCTRCRRRAATRA